MNALRWPCRVMRMRLCGDDSQERYSDAVMGFADAAAAKMMHALKHYLPVRSYTCLPASTSSTRQLTAQ